MTHASMAFPPSSSRFVKGGGAGIKTAYYNLKLL
jgi:hypothetical protein